MKIKTISDLKDIKGKRILLRVDFNVPLKENNEIADDSRIVAALKTIEHLQKAGARLILMSHLGRPGGKIDESLRLTKVAEHTSKLLKTPIKKLDDVIGKEVEKAVSAMKDGEIIMLENVRFEKGEKELSPAFTKALASLGDIFINDAFGTAHRAHASTAGLAKYLPAYGGFLMEKEIKKLSPLIEQDPQHPLVMIFGGAKINTKISVIKNFLDKADVFLIGGALANTFLAAAGHNIGKSLYEEDKVETARNIMLACEEKKKKIIIPHDVVVASEISENAKIANIPIEDVSGDMKILDIGKGTSEKFNNALEMAGTVIWNGPLGLTELTPFQNGTKLVATFLAKKDCTTIIGGGDTSDALKRLNIPVENFSHISTGGGACLEFLSGVPLPGIEALKA